MRIFQYKVKSVNYDMDTQIMRVRIEHGIQDPNDALNFIVLSGVEVEMTPQELIDWVTVNAPNRLTAITNFFGDMRTVLKRQLQAWAAGVDVTAS